MAGAIKLDKKDFESLIQGILTFSERNELSAKSTYHTDNVSFIGVELDTLQETPETLSEQIERILNARQLRGDDIVYDDDDGFDDDGFENSFNKPLHQSSLSVLDEPYAPPPVPKQTKDTKGADAPSKSVDGALDTTKSPPSTTSDSPTLAKGSGESPDE